MTVVNRQSLLIAQPIVDMLKHKQLAHGVSHGLTEAGYDIRIKQDVVFKRHGEGWTTMTITTPTGEGVTSARTFVRLRRCVLVDAFRIV